MSDRIVLRGFWRSGASHRTRIALNLKGLSYDILPVNLRAREQSQPEHMTLQPQGLVPVLEVGERVLFQSPAIIEWLEEAHPKPPLLPKGPDERAIVRGMAAIIGCDIQPLNNLRVLQALRQDFGASQEQIDGWACRWIASGFDALEILVSRHGGGFCFGDTPSLADCYLIPQVYSAERFGLDLDPYPSLRSVIDRAYGLDAFRLAHPDAQPDAPSPPT